MQMNQSNIPSVQKQNSFFTRIVVVASCALFLTSCSTYSSKFACSDSRGLPCEMLRSVDRKIDSGEIDKVYKSECTGKICKKAQNLDEVVVPKTGPIKAKIGVGASEDDVIITE